MLWLLAPDWLLEEQSTMSGLNIFAAGLQSY